MKSMKLGKIHNPLPQSLQEDIKKCTHIIQKFTKKELSNDSLAKVIPPDIIRNAKGICIMTVVKAGFLFSGRAGTGLVVARTSTGWSAPSAIGTAGMGFGGQIGAEVTDFVIILNTEAAVKAFSMGGNVTLGGNLSVAAGPFGRSAEAAGTVGKLAPIFSYSKTKGLFAGISIEGSVIVERKDANNMFYGKQIPPQEILSGSVLPPSSCQPLFEALNRQSELNPTSNHCRDIKTNHQYPYVPVKPAFTNDAYAPEKQYQSNDRCQPPQYGSSNDRRYSQQNHSSHPNSQYSQLQSTGGAQHLSTDRYSQEKQSNDRIKNPSINRYSQQNQSNGHNPSTNRYSETPTGQFGDYTSPPPPSRPPPPRRLPLAKALYKFSGERESDLSFEVGDVITVLKREDEWWRGRVGRREGDFPANYVKLEE